MLRFISSYFRSQTKKKSNSPIDVTSIHHIFNLDGAKKLPPPSRPISFVVVQFSDEYLHNFSISEAANAEINEVILVENRANLKFDSLSLAMADGIGRANNELVVCVHEDVLLPNGWQSYFESTLKKLESSDPNWGVLGSVGWVEIGNIFGHWKDPKHDVVNSFQDNPHGFVSTQYLDEQILIFPQRQLPALDLELPGIHHMGQGLLASAKEAGCKSYIIDAPTIHKYADQTGKLVRNMEDSEKIMDRQSLTYLADRSCCNDYIMHRWPNLDVPDHIPEDFNIPFQREDKLSQLDTPLILLGRGGGGTRLLGILAEDTGVFLGNDISESMDTLDMVDAIYRGVIEKYRCPADWQKKQIVPRLRATAARMINQLPANAPWGFKLPESILLLPEIAQAFPQAKFVHMVRDPLSTCLRRTHMTARMDNHIGRIALPLAYDTLGIERQKILEDSPAFHMVYTTIHQLGLIGDFLNAVPAERQYHLKFEDVLQDPARELDRFCQWLGRKPKSDKITTSVDINRASAGKSAYSNEISTLVENALEPVRFQFQYGGDC